MTRCLSKIWYRPKESTLNEYILLTPGPLTTSDTVKSVMMRDWCTWDDDYNEAIVQRIRKQLVELATATTEPYTSVLMQGSGTASVESVIGTAIGPDDKLLVINNGAYGARIAEIARYLKINHTEITLSETEPASPEVVQASLTQDPSITHVAVVHCETTTGMLNPIEEIAAVVDQLERTFIVDAMSSFGGIPMDIAKMNIGYLISSANKCIQGVPGFGFVIAKRKLLEQTKGQARSLSLDLHAQWECMEKNNGKWRFTSPTHVVRAFAQALNELSEEGGIEARFERYSKNQSVLVEGMKQLGFEPLLNESLHSPIITSFFSPAHEKYNFKHFYQLLKQEGFVIYPGKVSDADCFRIGNIGEVHPEDIKRLLSAIAKSCYWHW